MIFGAEHVANRSVDAQRAFCEREHGRLVGALSLYTGNRELAYDLTQEALARACRDWHKVQHMQAPGAWAYRVALNLARSHFRRRIVERRAQARMGRGEVHDLETSADRLALRAAIGRLPRRQREAVVLRYYVQMTVAEAALAMRCREGTVRALTAQGLANLRKLLAVDSGEEKRHAR